MFCGRDDKSKEDVIPGWAMKTLTNYWPQWTGVNPDDLTFFTGRRWGSQQAEGFNTKNPKRFPPVVTRAVCERHCNNGSMSNLEQKVEPLLAPTIRGQQRTFDRAQIGLIAFWAAKTALTLSLLRPEGRVVPDEHFRMLHELRAPLPGSYIFLSAYFGTEHPLFVRSYTLTPKSELELIPYGPKTHIWSYSIGHLALSVIWNVDKDIELVFNQDAMEGAVMPIWPNAPESLSWPGPTVLDDAALLAFSNTLAGEQSEGFIEREL